MYKRYKHVLNFSLDFFSLSCFYAPFFSFLTEFLTCSNIRNKKEEKIQEIMGLDVEDILVTVSRVPSSIKSYINPSLHEPREYLLEINDFAIVVLIFLVFIIILITWGTKFLRGFL